MKSQSDPTRESDPKAEDNRLPYQKPTIVYETHISTRAGSPLQYPDEPFDANEFLKWLQQ